MPRITNAEYQAILERQAARAARKAGVGAQGVPAANAECDPRQALERPVARKAADGKRFEILFTVYAVRPCDYDNYHCKVLQDCLVRAGFIPNDDWRTLQGRVISHKANNRQEERTEIVIQQLDSFGSYGTAGDAKWSGPS